MFVPVELWWCLLDMTWAGSGALDTRPLDPKVVLDRLDVCCSFFPNSRLLVRLMVVSRTDPRGFSCGLVLVVSSGDPTGAGWQEWYRKSLISRNKRGICVLLSLYLFVLRWSMFCWLVGQGARCSGNRRKMQKISKLNRVVTGAEGSMGKKRAIA